MCILQTMTAPKICFAIGRQRDEGGRHNLKTAIIKKSKTKTKQNTPKHQKNPTTYLAFLLEIPYFLYNFSFTATKQSRSATTY